MRTRVEVIRSLAAAAAFLAGCAWLSGGELIFNQLEDGQSIHGPSNHAPGGPVNAEVADDFDLTASIDRIVAYGFNFPDPVPDFGGVYVRFYASSGSGGPGALQQEYFLAAGDPDIVNHMELDGSLEVTLATPFSASGKHFVSVQPVTATAWYRWSANSHAVQGQPFYFRDPGSGANAWANNDGLDNYDTDIAFTLYGTVTAAGHIASLSAATLPRSGFLEILGTNFGGSGSVSIGGLTAPVATWSGERVVAYVPESSALGAVSVQLTNTSGQPSNSVSLDVTARVPDGRVQWRFRMDGPYSQVRPVIGPDGTIYTVDVFGHLYALSPDGGLKWVVRSGAKGVAVDANGDVYTASESHIRAFHSDGSAKWTFTQTPLAFILVGIGVGPDGNIYAAATEGMGVFSLTPDGDLRWQTPNPYDRVPIDYNEVVFGDNAGTGQLYFYANRRLRGITLAGDPVFEVVGGLAQLQVADSPAVSPDGSVHTAISAFSPDGDAIWTFDTPYPYNVFTKSSVGSNGIHYYVQNLSQLFALNSDGTVHWHAALADYVGGPIVDPTNTQLVVGGADTLDHPGKVISLNSADGSELWRVVFPMENGFNQFADTRARFSADGQTAYLVTATATGDNATSRSFVYAIDASLDGPPPPPPPTPSVFQITPPSGTPSGGGALTIAGSGYVGGATVTIGGAAAAAQVVDAATIDATSPSLAPGTLNDLTVTNPDLSSVTVPQAWFSDFLDVPQPDIFHAYVESIFRLGITAGCGPGVFCRDASVTREQMAVFLLKASNSPGYAPPACSGVFADVPCPGPFADWIEELAAQEITGGCGGGLYCPGDPVTRRQMAVFLLKAEHGAAYAPPACAGIFADVACPSLFADWIEQLAAEQITGGCGAGGYCPLGAVTRGQMAVFLVKTFHLQ